MNLRIPGLTSKCRLALLLAVVVGSLLLVPSALAGTPSFADACGSANNLDLATCERLDYIANELPDNEHRSDLIWWGEWAVVGLLIVNLVAPAWYRAWGLEGKLGPTTMRLRD